MQNPIQTISRFQNFFNIFFQKINFFAVSKPVLQRWEAWFQKKSIFSPLFNSAKSFSDHFTISEHFQCFFFKISIFFTVSKPILQRWETWGQKKSFLVLFYSAKSNSDRVKISNFSSFIFRKFNFFLLFRPLYCTSEKHDVSKKSLFSAFL